MLCVFYASLLLLKHFIAVFILSHNHPEPFNLLVVESVAATLLVVAAGGYICTVG